MLKGLKIFLVDTDNSFPYGISQLLILRLMINSFSDFNQIIMMSYHYDYLISISYTNTALSVSQTARP